LPAPWIGAQLWESVSPIFPFFAPPIAMLAMLPVMWAKFKLPSDAQDEVDTALTGVSDAAADARAAGD
jgi:hypothetical protein